MPENRGPVDKETQGEANVSAKQPPEGPAPRIPSSDVDPSRSSHNPQSAGQGPPSSLRLIWRVRDRSTLQLLHRRGRRGRAGVVTVLFLEGEPPPRVAFSVSRRVGKAVVRNRGRRRLREMLRELARDGQLRGGSYLVSAGVELDNKRFEDLRSDLHLALRRAGALS